MEHSDQEQARVIEMIRLLTRCMDSLATQLGAHNQQAIQQAAQQMYNNPRAYLSGQNLAARQYTYNHLRAQLEALLKAAEERKATT